MVVKQTKKIYLIKGSWISFQSYFSCGLFYKNVNFENVLKKWAIKKCLYDKFTLTDLKPYPIIDTLILLWRWVSLFSMNLSSQSKFPSFLLHTWDRLLYLVFFQEVLELYFKEGGLSFDKSSTIVKKTSSSLAMTSCLLTKITSQVFKYTSKKIAIRWILAPFECPHKLDWTPWINCLAFVTFRGPSLCWEENKEVCERKNEFNATKKK